MVYDKHGALMAEDRVFERAPASQYNRYHAGTCDQIRDFLTIHYAFNTALDTPFWRHCRADTDLAGAREVVEYYRENGPSRSGSRR